MTFGLPSHSGLDAEPLRVGALHIVTLAAIKPRKTRSRIAAMNHQKYRDRRYFPVYFFGRSRVVDFCKLVNWICSECRAHMLEPSAYPTAGIPTPPSCFSASCQWRKCLTPVKIIARPKRSAVSITSWSRTDPPGWIMAVAPAWAISSTPSGNGKNASEAATVPLSGS
jgi:hypothetical protein